ncbi:unnamed protein product [Amoebophrya sp. A25]|nr:unnamed protein product [Amoebophrya sp. A25]|eukprot:GSA25T00005446001.1
MCDPSTLDISTDITSDLTSGTTMLSGAVGMEPATLVGDAGATTTGTTGSATAIGGVDSSGPLATGTGAATSSSWKSDRGADDMSYPDVSTGRTQSVGTTSSNKTGTTTSVGGTPQLEATLSQPSPEGIGRHAALRLSSGGPPSIAVVDMSTPRDSAGASIGRVSGSSASGGRGPQPYMSSSQQAFGASSSSSFYKSRNSAIQSGASTPKNSVRDPGSMRSSTNNNSTNKGDPMRDSWASFGGVSQMNRSYVSTASSRGSEPRRQRPRRRVVERWIIAFTQRESAQAQVATSQSATPHGGPGHGAASFSQTSSISSRRLDERVMRKLATACRSLLVLTRTLPGFDLFRKKVPLFLHVHFQDAQVALSSPVPEEILAIPCSIGTLTLSLGRGRAPAPGSILNPTRSLGGSHSMGASAVNAGIRASSSSRAPGSSLYQGTTLVGENDHAEAASGDRSAASSKGMSERSLLIRNSHLYEEQGKISVEEYYMQDQISRDNKPNSNGTALFKGDKWGRNGFFPPGRGMPVAKWSGSDLVGGRGFSPSESVCDSNNSRTLSSASSGQSGGPGNEIGMFGLDDTSSSSSTGKLKEKKPTPHFGQITSPAFTSPHGSSWSGSSRADEVIGVKLISAASSCSAETQPSAPTSEIRVSTSSGRNPAAEQVRGTIAFSSIAEGVKNERKAKQAMTEDEAAFPHSSMLQDSIRGDGGTNHVRQKAEGETQEAEGDANVERGSCPRTAEIDPAVEENAATKSSSSIASAELVSMPATAVATASPDDDAVEMELRILEEKSPVPAPSEDTIRPTTSSVPPEPAKESTLPHQASTSNAASNEGSILAPTDIEPIVARSQSSLQSSRARKESDVDLTLPTGGDNQAPQEASHSSRAPSAEQLINFGEGKQAQDRKQDAFADDSLATAMKPGVPPFDAVSVASESAPTSIVTPTNASLVKQLSSKTFVSSPGPSSPRTFEASPLLRELNPFLIADADHFRVKNQAEDRRVVNEAAIDAFLCSARNLELDSLFGKYEEAHLTHDELSRRLEYYRRTRLL